MIGISFIIFLLVSSLLAMWNATNVCQRVHQPSQPNDVHQPKSGPVRSDDCLFWLELEKKKKKRFWFLFFIPLAAFFYLKKKKRSFCHFQLENVPLSKKNGLTVSLLCFILLLNEYKTRSFSFILDILCLIRVSVQGRNFLRLWRQSPSWLWTRSLTSVGENTTNKSTCFILLFFLSQNVWQRLSFNDR